MAMFQGVQTRIRQFAERRTLLREVKGIRVELARLADALELRNAYDFPQKIQRDPSRPAVEVEYVDTERAAELMEIELRLTNARGEPPTEDEILLEYDRRRAVEAERM